jgi:protein-tyrosine phosphatase
MTEQVNDNLVEAGLISAERAGAGQVSNRGFVREQYVDIHCHCLPGLDDGPATMSESLALCQALVDDGVTTVIATPHQLGRFSGCNEAAQVREAVLALNEELKSNDIALRIMPGADVRVDERICRLLEADKVLTLADGGKYILLELPHEVLIDIEPLFVDLASMGIAAIISHPERHMGLAKEPDILLKWLERSAHLQVTAGSLLGDFGPVVQRFGWQLLIAGWVPLVATDCHDLDGRRPRLRAAFERISEELGETFARLVCIENPLRVLKGQEIIAHTVSTKKLNNGGKPDGF